ncbi:MAG: aromatic amino acid transport family protein [Candidatus Endonucleobacter sp. (ex Gigantidas childressi)]|nr:aromatic amino acid transport family protein [Candidatus Endonucleobacter sp. (ex Gigantidas childressi)]
MAGTAIGAGMLALPIVTTYIGFFPALVIFVIISFFMALSALLMLEANLIIGKGSSLYIMAGQTLGRTGKAIATFASLGLFYSLTAAYIVEGGRLVNDACKLLFSVEITNHLATIIFVLIAGAIVSYGTRAVDFTNRFLFLLMLIAFCAAVVYLSPSVKYEYLSTYSLSINHIWVAIPIIFTSFGYHGSLPSVIFYERDNVSLLPRIFIIGTVLSLFFYIIWLAVSIGNLPQGWMGQGNYDGSIAELLLQLSRMGQNSKINVFLFTFSDLALLTSVLGVALGLFHYLASLFQRTDSTIGRCQTAALTFVPPVIFAFFFPEGFVSALGYAAIALSILAVLLPVVIVWVLRKKGLTGDYRAPVGDWMLAACFVFGVTVIVSQLIAVFIV